MNMLIRRIINFFRPSAVLVNRKAGSPVDESVIEIDKLNSVMDINHIKTLARSLGHDIVSNAVYKKNEKLMKSFNDHATTLRQTVTYLMEKHESKFVNMAEKISQLESIPDSFLIVADQLFMVGVCNWGRIATLYAFAACLAKYNTRNHDNLDFVRTIAETVGNYVSENLTEWIYSQGGWVCKICAFKAISISFICIFTL